jgi:tetratricopeptide (TPR) repeat protein
VIVRRSTAFMSDPCHHRRMDERTRPIDDGSDRGPRFEGQGPSNAGGPDEAGDREGAYELLQRGTALMRRRHFAQAAVVLSRAARLEPGKGSILEALGRAEFNAGDHGLARETFERLLEVDPSSPYGHYALGLSLKRLRQLAPARTHLRLAVALDPHSPLYRGALARLGPEPGGERDRRRRERPDNPPG